MTALEIVFHPAKQHPKKAALLGFVLGIGLRTLWQMLPPVTALALGAVILVSVRDFYLETRYQLSSEGISVKGALKSSKTYSWQRFRAFVEDRNGLFLTPYLHKRAIEQQRGVFLPMTQEDRRRAVEFCQTRDLIRRAA